MTLMVIVPQVTPKGKVSAIHTYDEWGVMKHAKLDTNVTRKEWIEEKEKLGFAVIADYCLVNAEAVATMSMTLDHNKKACAALPLQGSGTLLIPLTDGIVRIR